MAGWHRCQPQGVESCRPQPDQTSSARRLATSREARGGATRYSAGRPGSAPGREKRRCGKRTSRLIKKSWSEERQTVKRGLILVLKGYRRLISPLYPQVCKFYPSCSAYALEAIEKHGAAKGFAMAVSRLLRCHPFSEGGYDPVEQHKSLG